MPIPQHYFIIGVELGICGIRFSEVRLIAFRIMQWKKFKVADKWKNAMVTEDVCAPRPLH